MASAEYEKLDARNFEDNEEGEPADGTELRNMEVCLQDAQS